MIDLEPMWLALAKWQPYADVFNYGKSWQKMCVRRTALAAYDASNQAEDWSCIEAGQAARFASEAQAAEVRARAAALEFARATVLAEKSIEKILKAFETSSEEYEKMRAEQNVPP